MSPGPTPPHVSVATNARSTTPLTTSDGDGGRGVRGAGPAGRRARRAVRAAAPGRRRRARPLQPVQASTAAPYACGRPTAARPARRATARIAASLSAVLSPPRARELPSAMVGRVEDVYSTPHPLTALPVVPRAIWHTVCPRSLSADGKDVPVEGGFAGHRLARTFVPTLNVAVWCACAAGTPRPVRSAVRRNHHVSFGAPVCRSACLPAQSFNPSDLRVSPTLLSPTNPSKHAWRPSPSLGRTVPTAHQ